MPLLTELENLFLAGFYNDVAPMALGPGGVGIGSNADFIKTMSSCMKPGGQTPEKVNQMRVRWDEFKSVGEGFVLAAEENILKFKSIIPPMFAWLTTGELPEVVVAARV